RSVTVCNDELSVICGLEELPGGLQCYGPLGPPKNPRRDVDVAVVESIIDVVDADLACGKFMGIQLNMDGKLRRPPHLNLSDALNGRDTLSNQSFGIFVHSRERKGGRRHRQLEYGLIRGIDLPYRRRCGHVLRKQSAGLRDGILNILSRAVQTALQ